MFTENFKYFFLTLISYYFTNEVIILGCLFFHMGFSINMSNSRENKSIGIFYLDCIIFVPPLFLYIVPLLDLTSR